VTGFFLLLAPVLSFLTGLVAALGVVFRGLRETGFGFFDGEVGAGSSCLILGVVEVDKGLCFFGGDFD
jgi:hypothetical protein